MTVSNFDPQAITVTDAALDHLRSQIARSEHGSLRLGVKESGCNGYMYTLDYIDEPEPSDQAFLFGGAVTVYVREQELPLIKGTEVDYVTEGLNSSLKFKNAKATTYCGCGESFAMAGEAG